MSDLATKGSGASVIAASSFDIMHPPQNIIEGDPRSFWISTGVFPQELVIQLGESSVVKIVEVISTGIKMIELLRCDQPNPNLWEAVSTQEPDDSEGDMQRIQLQVSQRSTATYLKIRVLAGYTDFITIHKVSVKGSGR
mmetsp:Transcript_19748/g.19860  ORF Transcript_19748/g.19860 Transcript_19748/m.19860 type:complete len:139 (-) Transcript_19748:156-572(-)|eukprot:CAMPEP_0182418794 /NCGR_PEP_ID=MMETSP1167-20130531/3172_1 /TAXON_ID=2988 /ORGANISM="Mallomonas Sp, Strain CCMP3275" /LENGTH=138 /DNA_ID=CAMNT_0024593191 /DNA_START=240 /DNA_END=656 /DNA_ORIENTATION=+